MSKSVKNEKYVRCTVIRHGPKEENEIHNESAI